MVFGAPSLPLAISANSDAELECSELHWHPTQDEWSFFLEGNARVTLFASSGQARTFNYQPGDIGMSLLIDISRSSRFSYRLQATSPALSDTTSRTPATRRFASSRSSSPVRLPVLRALTQRLRSHTTDKFEDVSLNQWLALTPPDLVKAHLNLDDETIASLSKTKLTVNGPKSS